MIQNKRHSKCIENGIVRYLSPSELQRWHYSSSDRIAISIPETIESCTLRAEDLSSVNQIYILNPDTTLVLEDCENKNLSKDLDCPLVVQGGKVAYYPKSNASRSMYFFYNQEVKIFFSQIFSNNSLIYHFAYNEKVALNGNALPVYFSFMNVKDICCKKLITSGIYGENMENLEIQDSDIRTLSLKGRTNFNISHSTFSRFTSYNTLEPTLDNHVSSAQRIKAKE